MGQDVLSQGVIAVDAMWMPDSPILRLWWLKRLSGGGGEKIEVTWNNFQPPFSTELYKPYSSEQTSLEDVGVGVVRQIWITGGGSYNHTTRLKADVTVLASHIYYISYSINPSFSGAIFGIEFAGGAVAQASATYEANTWSRFSAVAQGGRDGGGNAYFGNRRDGYIPRPSDSCLLKAPIYVDLTKMYGAGNEPTLEEFERQCALNGIDLTQSKPQDSGTVREWRI